MLNNFFNKIKKKLALQLYNELLHYQNLDFSVEPEKRYHELALISENTNFSKLARIYNQLNDRTRIRIGSNCIISGDLLTYAHGGDIEIGNFVFIGENSRIWSALSIKIGNNVLISHNVNIHDNNSHPLDSKLRKEQSEIILTKGLPNINYGTKEQRIIIEDDVWIGYNASISKGVVLGKGSIIGAGSYVYSDVLPYSVMMGNPAKAVSKTQ